METIIELNENNEIEPTFTITVGIMFDGEFINKRLNMKEKDLCTETIGLDIKRIMQELKNKQIELLNQNGKKNKKLV